MYVSQPTKRHLWKTETNPHRRAIQRQGFAFVMVVRLAPFPYGWINLAFAAIEVIQPRQFLVATALSEVHVRVAVLPEADARALRSAAH